MVFKFISFRTLIVFVVVVVVVICSLNVGIKGQLVSDGSDGGGPATFRYIATNVIPGGIITFDVPLVFLMSSPVAIMVDNVTIQGPVIIEGNPSSFTPLVSVSGENVMFRNVTFNLNDTTALWAIGDFVVIQSCLFTAPPTTTPLLPMIKLFGAQALIGTGDFYGNDPSLGNTFDGQNGTATMMNAIEGATTSVGTVISGNQFSNVHIAINELGDNSTIGRTPPTFHPSGKNVFIYMGSYSIACQSSVGSNWNIWGNWFGFDMDGVPRWISTTDGIKDSCSGHTVGMRFNPLDSSAALDRQSNYFHSFYGVNIANSNSHFSGNYFGYFPNNNTATPYSAIVANFRIFDGTTGLLVGSNNDGINDDKEGNWFNSNMIVILPNTGLEVSVVVRGNKFGYDIYGEGTFDCMPSMPCSQLAILIFSGLSGGSLDIVVEDNHFGAAFTPAIDVDGNQENLNGSITIQNNHFGINLQGTNPAPIVNIMVGTGWPAIQLITGSPQLTMYVFGNEFIHGAGQGPVIQVKSGSHIFITDNYFGMLANGSIFCTHISGWGVWLQQHLNATNLVLSTNTIIGHYGGIRSTVDGGDIDHNIIVAGACAIDPAAIGVTLANQSTLQFNRIENWVEGVQVTGMSNSLLSNMIKHNSMDGIQVQGPSNTIMGNTIDSNSKEGINFVSFNNIAQMNIITGNLAGIISPSATPGQGNGFMNNKIFNNTGLGLHLGAIGTETTPNPNPGNNLPSAPTLSAVLCGAILAVNASASNLIPSSYVVFEVSMGASCDPSGYGEGQVVLGQLPAVQVDANGNATGYGEFDCTSALLNVPTTLSTCIVTGTTTALFTGVPVFPFQLFNGDITSEYSLCNDCSMFPQCFTPSSTVSVSPSQSLSPTSSSTLSSSTSLSLSPSSTVSAIPSRSLSPTSSSTISLSPSSSSTVSATPSQSLSPTSSSTISVSLSYSSTVSISSTVSFTPTTSLTSSPTPSSSISLSSPSTSLTPSSTTSITLTTSVSPQSSFTPSISHSSFKSPSHHTPRPPQHTPTDSPRISSSTKHTQHAETWKKGDINFGDEEFIEKSINITRKNHNQTIVVNLQSEQGGLIGRLIIPGGTLPVGSTLTLKNRQIPTHFIQSAPTKDGHSCPREREATRVSTTVDVNVSNGPSKGFKVPVKIQLLGKPDSQEDPCVGYSASDQTQFSCLPNTTSTQKNDSALYSANTSHFTSFAVLFLGKSSISSSCNLSLWIASVCLISSSILLVLLVALFSLHPKMNALIRGFHPKRRLTVVLGKVSRSSV